jgi:hypothetical protein
MRVCGWSGSQAILRKEMFLVQMSLDVKKAEILKLDEKAKMKDTDAKAILCYSLIQNFRQY